MGHNILGGLEANVKSLEQMWGTVANIGRGVYKCFNILLYVTVYICICMSMFPGGFFRACFFGPKKISEIGWFWHNLN